MRGPLAPELYDTARRVGSWWEASLPPEPPHAALDGDTETDVAIVGGGYAGLNAARALRAHGVGVTVLEAGRIGWGASGRNGGIVGPGGSKLSDAALRRRHGRDGLRRFESAQAAAVEWVRAFCEAEGLGEHMSGRGEVLLAHSRRAAAALRDLAKRAAKAAAATGGEPHAEPLPPSGQPDIARHGGAFLRPAFGIQPLAYVRALARAAAREGAAVHELSEIREWRHEGARHRLIAGTGSVLAERVIVATNGFTPDGLSPLLDGRAVPVISNIAVTRPLTDEELARHPWLGDDPAADTRHMLSYFRLVRGRLHGETPAPGGTGPRPNEGARLLLGMRGDTLGSDEGARMMRERIASRIAADFPGFAGVGIEHFWRGPVCATARLTPAVGWLDETRRIAIALGWHGSGIAMGSYGGRLAGELVATGSTAHIPEVMLGPPPRLPLPGLRPLYVASMMKLYTAMDAMTFLPSRKG